MDEVYDLHRHTNCVIFHVGKIIANIKVFSTSTRKAKVYNRDIRQDCYITYDKQKLDIVDWGHKDVNKNEGVQIDVSEESLYQLFKKGKVNWDQDDLFLFTAASEFIRLIVEELAGDIDELVEDEEIKIENGDKFHYVFVVPSEWEEEIKEVLIRPIFVQARLISKDDHQDRLLFCSNIESLYHCITDFFKNLKLIKKHQMILGRIFAVEKNQVSIQLDLISPGYPLFDFSGSVIHPKIINSTSLSLTVNDVKKGIREFIKKNLSLDAQEETVQNIMEELGSFKFDYSYENDEDFYLKKTFITDRNISEVDKYKEALLKSIRPFDICKEISEHLPDKLKRLLQNKLVKEYYIFKVIDEDTIDDDTSQIDLDEGLLNWSRFLFEYNRISFGANIIIPKRYLFNSMDSLLILSGAALYLFNAIQNSDIYSKPRILQAEHSITSSSIFLNSKPYAIIHINLSLKLTELSFSLLDENGLVKEIRNLDYLVPDKRLRSLGSYFSFSEVTSLTIENSFITFVKKYLQNETKISFRPLNMNMVIEVESIMNVEKHNNKDLLVTTQQQVYIKAFVLLYMIYINIIVSRKLPATARRNRVGYVITVESMLLKKLLGTEDNLKDIIYASNLVQTDDSYKRLRVSTQDEGLLPVIQQSFHLSLPLKSFFVVAQLHEDYVQLTVNQVVTESCSNEEYQESIIIQEEIIPTPNIYESLCFNMWNSITKDSGLIQLCNIHKKCNDNKLVDIFSLENQVEFTRSLKEYISKNILNKNSATLKAASAAIYLSELCNCKVCLTMNDITEISFRPVLRDIVSLVFTSLINNQLFGNYRNIQYLLQLIHFNYNPRFQLILMKILNDEADHFLYEQRIDVEHYTMPKLTNHLLQPALQQEHFSYKSFRYGVLHHVYSESYGFVPDDETLFFKNKISDLKITSIDRKTVFTLFKKGDKINRIPTNRVFYLNSNDNRDRKYLSFKYFKLQKTDTLRFGEIAHLNATSDVIKDNEVGIIDIGLCIDKSFVASVAYERYMPSLSLVINSTGDDINKIHATKLAEPMTLARF